MANTIRTKSREVVLTVEQWNKLIDELSFEYNLDIQEKLGCVELHYRGVIYFCSLTGEKDETPNPGNIWAQFVKKVPEQYYELQNKDKYGYRKIPIPRQKDRYKIKWNLRDPGGYSYTDAYRKCRWLKCYSYDVNSSYSYAMTKPMPDTTKEPRLNSTIKEGEIGFYDNGAATTDVGAYAEYIFPLIESPFTNYVYNYYEKKKKAKLIDDRNRWKYFLNIPSGMLQRHNIFIRLAILYHARQYIRQFIDDNTVYCNVDSIVSTKPRTDLPLGEELGQFKEEHTNEKFKYIDAGMYQWGAECHYKGLPGCTITDIEHIEGWKTNFPYKLENRRLICVRKEEYEKLTTKAVS